MPKNSSDLVPTRIINKNGVATTVHRKPSTSTATANLIPSPSITGTGKSQAAWLNDRLIKPSHVSDETMLNASKSFFTPDLGDLSQRLLSSGTRTGQQLATNSLSFYVGRLADHLHTSGKTSDTSSRHGNWMQGELIRKWNYGNIREEANLSPDSIIEEDFSQLKHAHSMVTAGVSLFDGFSEEDHYTMPEKLESYWRGVSALSLCFDFDDESDASEEEWMKFNDFIPWVARHENLGNAVRLAKKHRTIDPEKLEHFMDAEDNGVHGSTVEGWL